MYGFYFSAKLFMRNSNKIRPHSLHFVPLCPLGRTDYFQVKCSTTEIWLINARNDHCGPIKWHGFHKKRSSPIAILLDDSIRKEKFERPRFREQQNGGRRVGVAIMRTGAFPPHWNASSPHEPTHTMNTWLLLHWPHIFLHSSLRLFSMHLI